MTVPKYQENHQFFANQLSVLTTAYHMDELSFPFRLISHSMLGVYFLPYFRLPHF